MGDKKSLDRSPSRCIDQNDRLCVVLVKGDAPCPEALLEGLAKKGAKPLVVKEPVQVMAELALNFRTVVIVDRPETVPKLSQLLAAVRRYYPSVVCWGYGASLPGRAATLSRMNDQTKPVHADQPQLSRSDQSAEGQQMPEPLLTQEELSMLIGSDFGDAEPGEEAKPCGMEYDSSC